MLNLLNILGKLNLKPVFLIQGETGNGEEILLHSVAHYFGLHFYKVNNSDLMANVYAQNETKLRNIFFNGKMAAPCLITIFNFEVCEMETYSWCTFNIQIQ